MQHCYTLIASLARPQSRLLWMSLISKAFTPDSIFARDTSFARLKLGRKLLRLYGSPRGGKGGGHTGGMTVGIVAAAIVFWPAAPLFLLMHGKDISFPKGTDVPTFIMQTQLQGADVSTTPEVSVAEAARRNKAAKEAEKPKDNPPPQQ